MKFMKTKKLFPKSMKELNEECAEILRKLLSKHSFLQPDSKNFDARDANDSHKAISDLIEMLNYSDVIGDVHSKYDWGK